MARRSVCKNNRSASWQPWWSGQVEVVTREELRERIWGTDTFVDFEQSLNKAVNRLREASNDEAGQPRYVETVPRRGYRFIAAVTPPQTMEQAPEFSTPVRDGKIIFGRDCKTGRQLSGYTRECAFMIPAAGGEPEPLCESCTVRGFSSDGSTVLLEPYNPDGGQKPPDRIAPLDLKSRTEKEFLNSPDKAVYHPFFSWDDRWVVFKKQLEPVKFSDHDHAGAQWRPRQRRGLGRSHGRRYYDDKPQFSPDGNTVYFTSTRDGFLCIWAQRLNPVTKRPAGEPVAYEHFHGAAGRDAVSLPIIVIQSDLSVARDKMLINLPQFRADIWMTQLW